MATEAQILELRQMIDEAVPGLGSDSIYTDEYLSDRIDSGKSLESVAGAIWTEKAATFSKLVDIQEGSSKRALGQLQAQALKMATHYQTLAGEGSDGTARFSRTRAIERP